jgi:hypothetical protein
VRRRELFAAALAAGLAAPAAARGADRDSAILGALIAREEAAALAYRGVDLPGLGDPVAQDEDHVKVLRTELQALKLDKRPIAADDIDPAARRLSEAPADERRVAAVALETDLLAEYRKAVLGITEPRILEAVATILACHAQRRALVSAASYPP